jgi:membrane-associated phospholipid phosphatase
VALNMFHPIENMKFVLAVLMVLVGVVNYSRLKLQAHTPSQVYLGTLLGFFTCFFSVYYFL